MAKMPGAVGREPSIRNDSFPRKLRDALSCARLRRQGTSESFAKATKACACVATPQPEVQCRTICIAKFWLPCFVQGFIFDGLEGHYGSFAGPIPSLRSSGCISLHCLDNLALLAHSSAPNSNRGETSRGSPVRRRNKQLWGFYYLERLRGSSKRAVGARIRQLRLKKQQSVLNARPEESRGIHGR